MAKPGHAIANLHTFLTTQLLICVFALPPNTWKERLEVFRCWLLPCQEALQVGPEIGHL